MSRVEENDALELAHLIGVVAFLVGAAEVDVLDDVGAIDSYGKDHAVGGGGGWSCRTVDAALIRGWEFKSTVLRGRNWRSSAALLISVFHT